MPIMGTAGLLMAYMALALLLLSIHLYSNWNWWIKAFATLLLTLFYYVSYISTPHLLGWPTAYNLPARFRLIAFSIDENKGVYVWGFDLKYGLGLGTPRAYMLPYSKKLHAKIEKVGSQLKRGGTVIGEISLGAASGLGRENAQDGLSESNELSVNFIDAPEGLIPEKD